MADLVLPGRRRGWQRGKSYELIVFPGDAFRNGLHGEAQKRGYLFMTGDEMPYPTLSKHIVEAVVGGQIG